MDNEINDKLSETRELSNFETEYNVIEEYNDKKINTKVNFKLYLVQNAKEVISSSVTKKKWKLVKIELVKFSLEIKDWVSFWSQFKKIHKDNDIENEDKF